MKILSAGGSLWFALNGGSWRILVASSRFAQCPQLKVARSMNVDHALFQQMLLNLHDHHFWLSPSMDFLCRFLFRFFASWVPLFGFVIFQIPPYTPNFFFEYLSSLWTARNPQPWILKYIRCGKLRPNCTGGFQTFTVQRNCAISEFWLALCWALRFLTVFL